MKISAFITSLFVATSAIAGTNVPDSKTNGTSIVDATGTPCANPKAIALLANSFRNLTMKTWVEQNEQYKDNQSKQMLNQVGGWMQASAYTILPQHYYKAASGPVVAICTARVFVNGQAVVLRGDVKRNMLRYIVRGDTSFLIDYDVGEIGPWTFSDPKKEVAH